MVIGNSLGMRTHFFCSSKMDAQKTMVIGNSLGMRTHFFCSCKMVLGPEWARWCYRDSSSIVHLLPLRYTEPFNRTNFLELYILPHSTQSDLGRSHLVHLGSILFIWVQLGFDDIFFPYWKPHLSFSFINLPTGTDRMLE